MVYFFLSPALLFYATARVPLDFSSTGKLLQMALVAIVCSIALGWPLRTGWQANKALH